MQTGNITTPFGRRSISLALVRRQQALANIKADKTIEKWKVFRDASAARELLGVQSNSLAVLDALLSFYPENELRQDRQLIVFPSNVQLSLRAHGMPSSTLRRHLGALVDAGLIVRRDSANGKRFARKDASGDIENAFGFDLSPLLARAEELASLAQQVVAERVALRKAKESLTIQRRDVRKLILAAIEDGIEGDWRSVETIYLALVERIPRSPVITEIVDILAGMTTLKEEILNRLENQRIEENTSSDDAQTERHIQNSYPESIIESEIFGNERKQKHPGCSRAQREPMKAFPLSLVLKACPQIAEYGTCGSGIQTWRDLMSAAIIARTMLGVGSSAYQDACEVMGPESAAVAMSCILERANLINSAGAYLRDLTRRCERGEFSLGPMLMALLKSKGQEALRAY